MAGIYTFTFVEGEDFGPVLTWLPDSVTPADLTGWTARLIVEDSDGNPILMITTVSGADGSITLGGAAGTIALTIPAAVISAAAFSPGRYRLLMTNSGGITACLLRGQFIKETP